MSTAATRDSKDNPLPITETLPPSLQESILAVLAFDEAWGEVIAARVTADVFDEPGNAIAEELLAYRQQYHKPPGIVHLDDLFSEALFKEGRPTRISKVLHKIAILRDGLNGKYVANQVDTFIRRQTLKAAVMRAGDLYEQGGPNMLDEIENVLHEGLSNRPLPAGLDLISLQDKKAKHIDWLWQDRIPRGQHISMTGQSFVGKSMLLLSFAAQYSCGRPNPDGTPAPRGRVILLAQEDAIEFVIKPRLKALGADMSRIDMIGMARDKDGKERSFRLSEDLPKLKRLLKERPDTVMLGIDPVMSYMGGGRGKLDSHKATDVREVLEPLNKLAEDYRLLVFTITHPSKSSQTALNAFIGSGAFVQVPRLAYLAAKEVDEDKRETGRVFLSCAGSNIGVWPNTIAYRIKPVEVSPDESVPSLNAKIHQRLQEHLAKEPNANPRRVWRELREEMQAELQADLTDIKTARVVWDDVEGIDISADEILASARARGEAKAAAAMFLQGFLKDGPKRSTEIDKAAAELGISEKTLQRARKQFCRSWREGRLGEKGYWVCELKVSGEDVEEPGSSG